MGYPEGLNVPANFNPINGRVNYIPPDRNRQHPELARHGAARAGRQFTVDVGYVGNRSRNLMILGDFNQARPNAAGENARCRRAGRSRAISSSRRRSTAARATITRCRPRSSGAIRAGCTCSTRSPGRARATTRPGHLETANGDNSRVNFADIEGDFGLSGYNQPLNNMTTVVWELPFGRDRRWAATCRGARRDRWRLAPDGDQHDGERPAGQPDLLAVGDVQRERAPTYRPNLSGRRLRARRRAEYHQLVQPGERHGPDRLSQPFGNAARNSALGPAYLLDLGLHKPSRSSAAAASKSAWRRSTC